MAVGLTSPEIMERIVHQVIREGRYRAHIARTRGGWNRRMPPWRG